MRCEASPPPLSSTRACRTGRASIPEPMTTRPSMTVVAGCCSRGEGCCAWPEIVKTTNATMQPQVDVRIGAILRPSPCRFRLQAEDGGPAQVSRPKGSCSFRLQAEDRWRQTAGGRPRAARAEEGWLDSCHRRRMTHPYPPRLPDHDYVGFYSY